MEIIAMASIHKSKHGTHQVRYRIDGKLKSKTFKRKIDARKFKNEVELQLNSKSEVKTFGSSHDAQISFLDFSDLWIRDHAEVHKTPASVKRDKQNLKYHILPFLSHLELNQITKRHIIVMQSKLKQSGSLSDKTINNVIGTVHKILSDAVSWDYAVSNPVKGINRLKCPEIDYQFWTEEDRDRFLKYSKSRNEWLHDLVAFAVFTGLRRGEIQGLLRDSINYEMGKIIVKRNFCSQTKVLREHTKGKTIRTVPMNSIVAELMRPKRLLSPNQKIFEGDFNNLVKRSFRPMQIEAGVNPITFHALRHTFASHLIMKGVSVFEVQKLLGHSDIKTTMRYAHLSPDQLTGITDRLVPGYHLSSNTQNVHDMFTVNRGIGKRSI